MSKQKVIAIVGPTASGKSDLAVELAKKINGEIISADSRQVYRELDIGTGKVPGDTLKFKNQKSKLRNPQTDYFYHKSIRHHLLDIASPMKQFTVAEYQKLARRAIEDITKRGKVPILCGGTGLYIDATLYDLPIPSVKPNKALRKKLEELSAETLFKILKMKDPARARTIDRFNKRRLVRALEIVTSTGKAVPPLDTYYAHPRYDILKLGIKNSPDKLKHNIHARLIARLRPSKKLGVNQSMIREVQELLAKKQITHKRLEELGLEYRYIGRYLKGELTKIEMKEVLEKEIWRYGKRQMTWLRRDQNTVWIKNGRAATRVAARFLSRQDALPSQKIRTP